MNQRGIKPLIKLYQSRPIPEKLIINSLLLTGIFFFLIYIKNNIPAVKTLYEEIIFHLTNILLASSKFILTLSDYNIQVYGKLIILDNYKSLLLDRGCLGRNLMATFAGFVLAYPAPFKQKLIFIPLGLFIINVSNVLRIIGLVFTLKYYPQYVDINHHLIFKVFIYIIVFAMWAMWISHLNKHINKQNL